MEQIIINKKYKKLYRGTFNKILFGITLLIFLVGSNFLKSSVGKFSAETIIMIFFGSGLLLFVIVFIIMYRNMYEAIVDKIILEPETITFIGDRYTLKMDKSQINAITVEYHTVGNNDLTSFQILLKKYSNDIDKERLSLMKDELNTSFTNKDLNDEAKGEKVKKCIEFFQKYYKELLLVKYFE